jgi:hypothetical protein
MNSKIFVLIIMTLIFSGCTNKEVYNATQPKPNDTHRCMKLPESQYDECMEQGVTYDEYEKSRKEIIEGKKFN